MGSSAWPPCLWPAIAHLRRVSFWLSAPLPWAGHDVLPSVRCRISLGLQGMRRKLLVVTLNGRLRQRVEKRDADHVVTCMVYPAAPTEGPRRCMRRCMGWLVAARAMAVSQHVTRAVAQGNDTTRSNTRHVSCPPRHTATRPFCRCPSCKHH